MSKPKLTPPTGPAHLDQTEKKLKKILSKAASSSTTISSGMLFRMAEYAEREPRLDPETAGRIWTVMTAGTTGKNGVPHHKPEPRRFR